MSFDQGFQRFPRSLVETFYFDVTLGKGPTLQQMTGIGQKCTVDEGQPDMIGFDQGLADPRTDRTPSIAMIIDNTTTP